MADGLSWSSFIGQSLLLRTAHQAGLTLDKILADDVASPRPESVSFAIATNDLVVFTRGSEAEVTAWAAKVDSACDIAGIERAN